MQNTVVTQLKQRLTEEIHSLKSQRVSFKKCQLDWVDIDHKSHSSRLHLLQDPYRTISPVTQGLIF